MEITRQEGSRGRASRSRKDASNKENICPSQGRVSMAAGMAHRRRSPLPEGFPRSPLQDITHIVCPHNIWPENEDPSTDQVCKKFRKDDSAGSCTANEMGGNSSWKGLAHCARTKSKTEVVQLQETRNETNDSKQSTDVDAVAITGKAKISVHEQDLCIHKDEVSNDAISLSNCEIEGAKDVKSEEQSKQMGALEARACVLDKKISAEESELKQDTGGKSVQMSVARGYHTKRSHQPVQLKKKSSVSMFR